MTEIEPMFDYLVVEKDDVKETTSGGIILADKSKEKPSSGIVKKAGQGYYTETGVFCATKVVPGDRVMFPRLVGQTFEVDGNEVFLIKERDIIGIIK